MLIFYYFLRFFYFSKEGFSDYFFDSSSLHFFCLISLTNLTYYMISMGSLRDCCSSPLLILDLSSETADSERAVYW